MPAQERGPIGPSRNITRPAFHRASSPRGRYTERMIPPRPAEKPQPNAIKGHGDTFQSAIHAPEIAERADFWAGEMRKLRNGREHSPRAIDIFVGRALAHKEHEAKKAKNDAERDPLTELYNKKGIERRFGEALSRAERHNEKISITIMDLDKFKEINDRYGHPSGDAVLRHTATHLRSSGRGHDIWGRWGGEEFIGILPGESTKQAARAMERQRIHLPEAVDKALTHDRKFDINRDITMSVGIATYDPVEYAERFGTRPEQLRRILIKKGHNLSEMTQMDHKDRVAILKDAEKTRKNDILHHLAERADRAMYKAKDDGRDRVVVLTDDDRFINARSGSFDEKNEKKSA